MVAQHDRKMYAQGAPVCCVAVHTPQVPTANEGTYRAVVRVLYHSNLEWDFPDDGASLYDKELSQQHFGKVEAPPAEDKLLQQQSKL
jgi:hypothetical protein